MGITVKEHNGIVWDRNAALLVIYCDDDSPLNWRILTQWQEAPYDGDTRLDPPRANVEETQFTFGQIKDYVSTHGFKAADELGRLKELIYELRNHKVAGTGPFAPAK